MRQCKGKTMKERSIKPIRRIVIKIGSSSLTHKYTGLLNLGKVEKLTRILCDLKNQGMDLHPKTFTSQ